MWEEYPRRIKVAELASLAKKRALQISKKEGRTLNPAKSKGRKIAKSFWGFAWCQHLEKYVDSEFRLPRGRSYIKNDCVLDLKISQGKIQAIVSGSEVYELSILVDPLEESLWESLKEKCSGCIDSTIDLLAGKISEEVMVNVTDPSKGLFPQNGEIHMNCNCPDWSDMCKHVAAALYGVGTRLDEDPSLLFLLRGVSAEDLVKNSMKSIFENLGEDAELEGENLENLFDVEFASETEEKQSADFHKPATKEAEEKKKRVTIKKKPKSKTPTKKSL